MEKVQNRNKL